MRDLNIKFVLLIVFLSFTNSQIGAAPIKPLLPDSLSKIFDESISAIRNEKYDKACDYINRIKAIGESRNNAETKAAALYLEGVMFNNVHFLEKAEKDLIESNELFIKTHQPKMLCLTYYILGQVIEKMKVEPDKQLYYFKKSLEYAIEIKDTFRIIRCYDAVGCSYSKLLQFESAILSSKKAEEIMTNSNPNYLEPNVFTNLSDYYLRCNMFPSAELYIKKALDFYKNKNYDYPDMISEAKRIMGVICIKTGRVTEGVKYLKETLDYCRKNIDDPLTSKKVYDLLINIAAQNKDYKQAFQLQKEYSELRDTASKRDLSKRIYNNQVLLDIAKNEKNYALLKSNLNSEKSRNQLILSLTFLLGVLSITLIVFYNEKKNFNKKLELEVAHQTETLVQKNMELERFAFIASHDLRTPLRNIISFSGLLDRKLRDNPDKDTKEYLGFIKDYAHHMNSIIHDILNFSKIGKDGEENIEQVDMNEVTNTVLKSLKDKIQEHNAVIHTEGVLPTIMANKTHIIQLVQNIIENALTYNESEQPEIRIGTQNDENGMPTIYVQDNGIGVDEQYQAKVFEMFTRLHNIEKYPGTGLGLAICKKIVVQYGGRIWLNSTLGKGTTVHLALPTAA